MQHSITGQAAFGSFRPVTDRAEGGFNRVRGSQALPVARREVIEGQQFFPVLVQHQRSWDRSTSKLSSSRARAVPPLIEQGPESFDQVGWPLGEVGQGAFADPFAFAIGFTQEDGRRGLAVGYGFYEHGHR